MWGWCFDSKTVSARTNSWQRADEENLAQSRGTRTLRKHWNVHWHRQCAPPLALQQLKEKVIVCQSANRTCCIQLLLWHRVPRGGRHAQRDSPGLCLKKSNKTKKIKIKTNNSTGTSVAPPPAASRNSRPRAANRLQKLLNYRSLAATLCPATAGGRIGAVGCAVRRPSDAGSCLRRLRCEVGPDENWRRRLCGHFCLQVLSHRVFLLIFFI